MAIGFRREYTPSTIDFSYLDVDVPDFKSTPKVGETSQAPAMDQSGSSDRDPRIDPISSIPAIPPMAPIQVPDNYDFDNTVYNPNTGEFQAHTYPKIPTLLGTKAVENTMLYGSPSGSSHLTPGQVKNIQDNALAHQANILETTQNMPVGSTTQEIFDMANLQATGFDQYGNYHPEYDPAVAAHQAEMAKIPFYGAHSSSSAGAAPIVDAITNGINLGGPDTSATNIGFTTPMTGYEPGDVSESNMIDAGVDMSGHDVGASGGGKG